MQDPKKSPKIAFWAPSHNFVGLYLRNEGTYRQSEKKLVKQQYLPHMSAQYGELRPTSSWNRFVSLGHPSKFQPVSRLGSVNARQSSSERQPNFAALNRGRHLCSAGRPSRWALAHIVVLKALPPTRVNQHSPNFYTIIIALALISVCYPDLLKCSLKPMMIEIPNFSNYLSELQRNMIVAPTRHRINMNWF